MELHPNAKLTLVARRLFADRVEPPVYLREATPRAADNPGTATLLLPLFLLYLVEKDTEEYPIHRYAFGQFKPLKKFMKYSLNHIVMTHDIRGTLHEMRCRVLLINRSGDRVVRMEDMEYMRQRFPDCRGLRTVIGGGHMFHYTRSSVIIEFMEMFYEQIAQVPTVAKRER